MTAKEIYRPPFRNDGAYIWTADNVMALMATDCMHDPEKLMERTCQILNGEVKSNGNPNLTYVNGEILNGANVILVVRGFGHITGKGGIESLP